MSDRFVIAEVTGFAIRPEGEPSGAREPVPSFTVLDSAFGYRIVGRFGEDSDSPNAWRRHERDAYGFCRDLNHWDDLFGREPVPEFAP